MVLHGAILSAKVRSKVMLMVLHGAIPSAKIRSSTMFADFT